MSNFIFIYINQQSGGRGKVEDNPRSHQPVMAGFLHSNLELFNFFPIFQSMTSCSNNLCISLGESLGSNSGLHYTAPHKQSDNFSPIILMVQEFLKRKQKQFLYAGVTVVQNC